MITRTGEDWIAYHEGMFSVCIYNDGSIGAWHPCKGREGIISSDKGMHIGIDILFDDEVRHANCNICGELDIPENLQAMYILYKYGQE